MNIAKWVVSWDNYRGQNPLIAVTEAAKLMRELTEKETFPQHLFFIFFNGDIFSNLDCIKNSFLDLHSRLDIAIPGTPKIDLNLT